MKQVLTVNKGVNKDVNPLYLGEGEVLSRKNARVSSFDGSRVGINVSLKGMLKIEANLPSGTNRAVGRVEDIERNQLIFANWNSGGNHGVYKLKSDTVTALSEGSFWNFQEDYPVQMAVLGDYVFLTDKYKNPNGLWNPPRKLNVVSPSGTDENTQVALRHPADAPSVVLGTDTDKKINKLVGKTFQFATYFIYSQGGEVYSVLSPYSKVVVSSAVFGADDNTFIDSTVGNFVNVEYDLGSSDVSKVVLLAREGNSGSWFIVEEHEKVNPTGTRSISFYNDVAREFLPTEKALALFSDVPLAAKSVVSVQNRIGYANVVKGYNKTSVPYTLEVEYEDVDVDGVSTPIGFSEGQSEDTYYIEWTIPSATVGQTINVSIYGTVQASGGGLPAFEFLWSYDASYVVQTGDTVDDIVNYFANDISERGDEIIVPLDENAGVVIVNGANGGGGVTQLQFVGAIGNPSVTLSTTLGGTISQDTPPVGVATYKAGSYYNVGGLFYDKRSRTSGVLSPQRVYIPSNGERDYADVGKRARIKFTMGSPSVPLWADKFRFAVTESINFVGVYPFITGNDTATNVRSVFVDGKQVLAINMPRNLQYEFVNGDYLQIEKDTGSISTIVKTIIGTRTIVEDNSGNEHAGYWLIIPQGSQGVSDYENVLCTIHRQKDEVGTLIYFEDYNTYDANSLDSTTGYVGDGDAWFTNRTFEWDGGTETEIVEDFVIDPDSGIRAYSKGRAVLEYDTLGQINLQDFVWSETFLDNTSINGTSFFDSLNRIQLDEKDGQITRVLLVGDVLKAIQEDKETSLYVGKEQISNANGSLQLVKSGNFIGTVYPSVDDYGSIFPDSIIKNNRNLYYFDSGNGEVVRSSPNGQLAISDYGLRAEFQRISKDVQAAYSTDSRTVRVISAFDEKNNEFVITFDIRGETQTLIFKEGENIWISEDMDFTDASGNPPILYGNIGNQLYSFLDDVYKHEATSSYNTFYGDNKTLSVRGVVNTPPTAEKCLRSINTDSNRAPSVVVECPATNTMPLGLKSVLYPASFRDRLGNFTSSVFKNIRTASGEDLSLIHSGVDMVGKYIEIEMSDSGTTEYQLRVVTVNTTLNE